MSAYVRASSWMPCYRLFVGFPVTEKTSVNRMCGCRVTQEQAERAAKGEAARPASLSLRPGATYQPLRGPPATTGPSDGLILEWPGMSLHFRKRYHPSFMRTSLRVCPVRVVAWWLRQCPASASADGRPRYLERALAIVEAAHGPDHPSSPEPPLTWASSSRG